MKTVFLIFGMLMFLNITAQNLQKEIINFIQEQPAWNEYKEVEDVFSNKIEDIRKEEKQILKLLIQSKDTVTEINKRGRIGSFFKFIALHGNNKKIRQRALYLYFDMYFWGENRPFELPKELYTKKTIAKILELINGYNKKEIVFIINGKINSVKNDKSVRNEYLNKFKNTTLSTEQVQDSISNMIIADYSPQILKKYQSIECNQKLILLIGWLYYYKAVPIFEKYLQEGRFKTKENKLALKYALARMGKEKYFNEIVNEKQEFDFEYINTQEAYWKYIENNYYFDKFQPCWSEGEWPKENSATAIINIMSIKILNTPKEFKSDDPSMGGCFYKDELEEGIKKVKKAYEWYKTNRGHYVFKDITYVDEHH